MLPPAIPLPSLPPSLFHSSIALPCRSVPLSSLATVNYTGLNGANDVAYSNTDDCSTCLRTHARTHATGRECNPVNNRETPVVFTPPVVDTGIPSYKETMTGSGATYNLKVTDTAGNSWVVAKKYTDFAMLHKALKGATWSDARPSPQPFPKKESFPSVPARAKLFASYLHWITTHIVRIRLAPLFLGGFPPLVFFLCLFYYRVRMCLRTPQHHRVLTFHAILRLFTMLTRVSLGFLLLSKMTP